MRSVPLALALVFVVMGALVLWFHSGQDPRLAGPPVGGVTEASVVGSPVAASGQLERVEVATKQHAPAVHERRAITAPTIVLRGNVVPPRNWIVELTLAGGVEHRLLTDAQGAFDCTVTQPVARVAIVVRDTEGPVEETFRERFAYAAGYDWNLGEVAVETRSERVRLEVVADPEVIGMLLASSQCRLTASVRGGRENGPVLGQRTFELRDFAARDRLVAELDVEIGVASRPVFVSWTGSACRFDAPRIGWRPVEEVLPQANAPRCSIFSLRREDVVMGHLLYLDDTPVRDDPIQFIGDDGLFLLESTTGDDGEFCFVVGPGRGGLLQAANLVSVARGSAATGLPAAAGQEVTVRRHSVPLRFRLLDASGRPVRHYSVWDRFRSARRADRGPGGVAIVARDAIEQSSWLQFALEGRPDSVFLVPPTWFAKPNRLRDVRIDDFEPTGTVRVECEPSPDWGSQHVVMDFEGTGVLEGITRTGRSAATRPFSVELPGGSWRFDVSRWRRSGWRGDGTVTVVPGRETRIVLTRQ